MLVAPIACSSACLQRRRHGEAERAEQACQVASDRAAAVCSASQRRRRRRRSPCRRGTPRAGSRTCRPCSQSPGSARARPALRSRFPAAQSQPAAAPGCDATRAGQPLAVRAPARRTTLSREHGAQEVERRADRRSPHQAESAARARTRLRARRALRRTYWPHRAPGSTGRRRVPSPAASRPSPRSPAAAAGRSRRTQPTNAKRRLAAGRSGSTAIRDTGSNSSASTRLHTPIAASHAAYQRAGCELRSNARTEQQRAERESAEEGRNRRPERAADSWPSHSALCCVQTIW